MKNTLIFLVLTLILIFNTSVSHAGWLIYHKPEFKGKVIDSDTKEPIEGAVVVAIYKKDTLISGPGGGYTSIIKIKEALTDENGEFYIPSYTTIIQPLSKEEGVSFIIFKPGYGNAGGISVLPQKFIIWALPEGLAFHHKISETLKRRVEDAWRRDFEEFIKTLPEKQRARMRFNRTVRYQLPILPMKDAKKRLQALDIPFFTLPDDIGIESIKWINMFEEDITYSNLKEKSDYMVIGLPKLNTWEERRKANRIAISAPERKWPLLNKAIEKEEEWLRRNRGWKRKIK